MSRLSRSLLCWPGILATAFVALSVARCPGQDSEWIPTTTTHAWARFGPHAWKEVRVRTDAYKDGEIERSSTTTARTRVVRVGRHSFSLCVTSTVELAGREFPSAPQEFTRNVAPNVESSKVVGQDTLTIDAVDYPVRVISVVTKNGTKRETSTLYLCQSTYPQTLKRVTVSVDTKAPDLKTETIVTVTELGRGTDILGETKCTWSVTTRIKMPERTMTIQEVNCRDVPGELVSQLTEERDADGKLVGRKELELVGYGPGRRRRLFRRR